MWQDGLRPSPYSWQNPSPRVSVTRAFLSSRCLPNVPFRREKSVFGEKDPAAIINRYKEMTYIYKAGKEPEEGKIPVGVFRHDDTAEEYIDKVERKLKEQGIERG